MASSPSPVAWYRSPLPSDEFKALHRRSDLWGAGQTLGYLGVLTVTGTAAFLAAGRLPVWAVVALIFAHGMGCAFLINGVHELCHGTVFRTAALNAAFVRVLAFIGWTNFEMFWSSHKQHHRHTLHPPDDLEVVLPTHLFVRHFLLQGFVDFVGFGRTLRKTWRVARGRREGPWEHALFPAEDPAAFRPAVRWARILLAGHGLILAVSLYFHLWLLPVLTTLAPFYGGWLFFLCNNTQHMGLQDNVADFRLCCRTITLSPFVQFMYWHMNFHIEHHMYATVPCYRLGRLHRLIEGDLPPSPHGVIAAWRQIAAIQRRQAADPTYQYIQPLPARPGA